MILMPLMTLMILTTPYDPYPCQSLSSQFGAHMILSDPYDTHDPYNPYDPYDLYDSD